VRTVRAHRWRLAILTALFVLQAPLCSLACIEDSHAASDGPPPCHAEAPTSAPEEAPRSHDDCGCESSAEVVPLAKHASPLAEPAAMLPAFALRALAPAARWDRRIAGEVGLPPPDLLLRKSTLNL
jgi:hypothetical protein